MLMRSRPCHRSTARSTAAQKTRNCRLSCGVSPGVQQVVPGVVAHAPVQVLARAVHARERLLVQQAREAVLRRDALQRLHHHHLVIGGDVRVLEHRRNLVLARRDLVVARLHRHAALVQLGLHLHHVGQHALGDRAEVLVFHLLALGRPRAEERAAGVDQVGPVEEEVPVDEEVFLLGAARRDDAPARAIRTASGSAAPAPRSLPASAAAASSCRAPRPSSSRRRSG